MPGSVHVLGFVTMACLHVLPAAETAAQGGGAPESVALPAATANDQRNTAGTLHDGVLALSLVAQRARWYPLTEHDPYLEVDAFGAEGGAPSVPGPLVRVPRGTTVRLSLRNTLADTLVFSWRCGLESCDPARVLTVAPGEIARAEHAADEPGTFTYWALTLRNGEPEYGGDGGQLVGTIVVEEPRSPPDRVFTMTVWVKPRDAGDPAQGERVVFAINGKAWPHTERFTYTVGDTVRWRWISIDDHPMHLHGFYFRVDARGDGATDTIYAPAMRRHVVTEDMRTLHTAAFTWVPERPGNWLFHCHRAFHIAIERNTDVWETPPAATSHGNGHDHAHGHQQHAMGGLVIGMTVLPRRGGVIEPPPIPQREFRLVVQRRVRAGSPRAFGFVLEQDGVPAADSVVVPGPALVLRRGEPVQITVFNRSDSATAVHWHGIELDSYFDGVPGWSGAGDNLAPMIAPGDSFAAIFSPPRAGTFIYHSHVSELDQLGAGMYGAIVVLEHGQEWDPATDHVFVIGEMEDAHGSGSHVVTVNGTPAPGPLRRAADRAHRFRFINILAQNDVGITLVRSDTVAAWRLLAKDGADLPEQHSRNVPARIRLTPGETLDVHPTLEPGRYFLMVRGVSNNVLQTIDVR